MQQDSTALAHASTRVCLQNRPVSPQESTVPPHKSVVSPQKSPACWIRALHSGLSQAVREETLLAFRRAVAAQQVHIHKSRFATQLTNIRTTELSFWKCLTLLSFRRSRALFVKCRALLAACRALLAACRALLAACRALLAECLLFWCSGALSRRSGYRVAKTHRMP